MIDGNSEQKLIEQRRNARRAWRERNPDYDSKRYKTAEYKMYMEAYKKEHPNFLIEKKKRWKARHPEAARLVKKQERALRRSRIDGTPNEKIDPMFVYVMNDGICGICGNPLDISEFTMDHIIPISKGGGHLYANVHSAHKICNIRRGNRPLEILYSI